MATSSEPKYASVTIDLNGTEVGPIFILLNTDLAPTLCENFIHFCHNDEDRLSFVGMTGTSIKPSHLALKMPFARTKWGAFFPNKTEWHSDLKHNKKGVVSYQSQGNIINGDWAIFYNEQPLQDANFAPFGQVVEQSLDLLDLFEAVATGQYAPFIEDTITVTKCEMVSELPPPVEKVSKESNDATIPEEQSVKGQ